MKNPGGVPIANHPHYCLTGSLLFSYFLCLLLILFPLLDNRTPLARQMANSMNDVEALKYGYRVASFRKKTDIGTPLS